MTESSYDNYRVFKTWMQIITQTRYLLLCSNFFTLTYIELAIWKLFLTLNILSSKITKIFKGECLVDPIHKALSNCSLCGQAPRAFHRIILRSARSLRRGAKKEADSASSTILPRDWDWPCRQAIKLYHVLYHFRYLFSRFLQEYPCTLTDFKILLLNGYFNFAAFICVVGQKKWVTFRNCLSFVNFLHRLGLKSCDTGIQSHYFAFTQKYHYF